MKPKMTKQRLIELGNSLQGIIRELEQSLDTPEPNPRKRRDKTAERRDKTAERRAYYANLIDTKIEAKRRKAKKS